MRLSATQLEKAIHAWNVGGSCSLGRVRAEIKCGYGELLHRVLDELASRGEPSGLDDEQPATAGDQCPGCGKVEPLNDVWLICDACLCERINGAGELEVDDPDDDLYGHFRQRAKANAQSASVSSPEGPRALPARRVDYLVPEAAKITHCRYCNAEIVWHRTERGKAMPLSVASIIKRDGQLYALSHFSDCTSYTR